jgi:Flp pilus assembly protein TadD
VNADELLKNAVQKLKHGQIDSAIEDLKSAVQLNTADPQVHNYLGIAYSQKGMKDEAIAELRKACELNPVSPLIRFNLGMVFLEIGHTDVAKSCFRRALLIDPSYQKARDALRKLEPMAVPNGEQIEVG